jgi:hypothetical protein
MTSTVTSAQDRTEAARKGVKLGDVFYRSWGYDQTNVNFYEVVGFTASNKSMRLREIRKTVQGRGVVPVKGDYRFLEDDVHTKRIQLDYTGIFPCAAWNSYSSLSLFEGKPVYDTIALGYEGH